MLTFIGLGLYDERSITVEGRTALRDADRAYVEFYTSRLLGATVDDLERHHDVEIEVLERADVEQHPERVLDAAERDSVAFCTAGDTMIATTHTDLRLRAHDRGIDTRVVHGVTAETAAASLTGLQNYRFGKATTLPFEYAHAGSDVPDSVLDTITDNRARGLHTLVFLDIKVGDDTAGADERDGDEYMTADHAASRLAAHHPDTVAVVVARAGSPTPLVQADTLQNLADRDFGDPLHLLVIPGDCHLLEADALEALADAPRDQLDVA
ncbi:diphthine synthase [Halorubellus sp. JP-L1]|uniref:diphthine synthase n=1 Tax=Halorubellus sp. JP-L1 TaxID=2715753 RepID=UPI00140B5008|nr:diphthine synthase [Halorubellus sp. JP-L1]NHN41072.1 diphthine synthase [Halorubellus sp. JP-L1]